ncbi:histidine phosphatase family protein [Dictyobacter halimunensis]
MGQQDTQPRWRTGLSGWLRLWWFCLGVEWRYVSWRMRLWLYPEQRESIQTPMKQTLLIVRHGQTTWNVEHRLPGQLPGVSLNEVGRQQAARLAEALRVLPLSSIISSPLERAYHTAEYLAQGRDLEIIREPDLMDTNVGPWAGQVIDELAKNDPAWKAYVKDPTVAPEGIETFPQVQQRVVAAVERWLARENIGAYPVFVAHADVVKLLLAHYAGLNPAQAGVLTIDNASVSMVEIPRDKPEESHPHVVAIGWNPQPGWLKAPEPEKPAPTDTQEAGEQKT